MPLHVTDYTWTQTESMVYINVPLKGAKARNADVVSTDNYLKLHFPPYLFEAFLFEPVDENKGSAKVGNGVALFSLPKRTNKLWDHLMITTNDKDSMRAIREEALEKHQQKLRSEAKQSAEKRQAEKKHALDAMMKLEKEERDRIQQMKDAEREKTSAELAAWRLRHKQEVQIDLHQEVDLNQQKGENGPAALRKVHHNAKSKKIQAGLNPPRISGNIQITFTPRVFPTALRESQAAEEEEWLQKQAEARRAVSVDVEEEKDLTEEERNPDWLKEKGDKCFAMGDFLGALNAYSLAIRITRNVPALYSNRAACHLKLRNLHKAIQDATQALDLLTPAVPANAAARARASVRRGSAFCQLELYAEGLLDYEAALKIHPHNEALRADAQRIRDIIQGSAAGPDCQRKTCNT